MKKKYMAPAVKMHKIVSLNLICNSLRGQGSVSIPNGGGTSGNSITVVDSRRVGFDDDDFFDEFENGSIWDF